MGKEHEWDFIMGSIGQMNKDIIDGTSIYLHEIEYNEALAKMLEKEIFTYSVSVQKLKPLRKVERYIYKSDTGNKFFADMYFDNNK